MAGLKRRLPVKYAGRRQVLLPVSTALPSSPAAVFERIPGEFQKFSPKNDIIPFRHVTGIC
jgi:hypothetical protein